MVLAEDRYGVRVAACVVASVVVGVVVDFATAVTVGPLVLVLGLADTF